MKREPVADIYIEVTYLCLHVRMVPDGATVETQTSAGGSGSRRIWLSELPAWMERNPGAMICSMRPA